MLAADESVQTALTTEENEKPQSPGTPQQIFTKDQQWQLQPRSPAQPLAANSLNARQQEHERTAGGAHKEKPIQQ